MAAGASLVATLARWRRYYPAVKETLDVLGIIGLLAGGLFAAMQYLDAQQGQRVSRTFEYIERYESGDVALARRAIDRFLRPYLPQFEELKAEGLPCGPRDDFVRSIIMADVAQQQAQGATLSIATSPLKPVETIEDQIDRVVEFYDGLKICVDEELCSRRVATNYFSPEEVGILWNNFYPYITDRRTNYAQYGDALEWFAGDKARMCGSRG